MKESRKCEKRRHFNKKAKCRLGYFKCETDPNLKLIKSTYQEALQKCNDFGSINEAGKGYIIVSDIKALVKESKLVTFRGY